tara:strand:+ start:366 stop:626 length:261 start_codon:yes stop_codon:yes gene_type:complete
MDINELIAIIKKKIESKVVIENIVIEDKSFLHKNHKGNQKDKFHIKIHLKSRELNQMNKINANKKIYSILENEMNLFIHSIQILIQ